MMLHFLNDVVDEVESTQNSIIVIVTCLKMDQLNKLINRIPGSLLLISSLIGSAWRTHVESLQFSMHSGSRAW